MKDTGEGPFLRTGDLGFIDDNGELFVTGRAKDLIIVRGVNYYPQDIELTVQHSHPRLRARLRRGVHRREGRPRAAGPGPGGRAAQAGRVPARSSPRSAAAVARRARSPPRRDRLHQGGERSRRLPAARFSGTPAAAATWTARLDVVGQWQSGEPLPEPPPAETRRAKPTPAEEADSPPAPRCRPAATASPAVARRGERPGVEERLPRRRRRKGKTAELVIEEIRRVAKERADGMTLDSPIVETGLDSLERMEILASLEERFGGRFPPEILPELETTRQVIEAVEKYLGGEPRQRTAAAETEIPRGSLSHRTLPRIPATSPAARHAGGVGRGQPLFHRPPGNHQRPHDDRRPRVHQFRQLQLRRHVGRSGRGQGRQGRHRPLRHERFRQPPGLRREGVARRVGAGDCPSSSAPRRR